MIQMEPVKTAAVLGDARNQPRQLGIKPLTKDIPRDLHGCLSFHSNAKCIYILNNAFHNTVCVCVCLKGSISYRIHMGQHCKCIPSKMEISCLCCTASYLLLC